MSGWVPWLVLGAAILVIWWLKEQAATARRRRRVCPGCREERLRRRGRWVVQGGRYRLRPLSRREQARRARLPIPEHTCRLGRKAMREHTKFRARVHGHNRRVLLTSATGSYTQLEWSEVLSRYDRCPGCGRTWKDIRPLRGRDSAITIDHIVPLSRGGANDVSNLQPLCHSCNSRKGNRMPSRPTPRSIERRTEPAMRTAPDPPVRELDPASAWYRQRFRELHAQHGTALPDSVLKPFLAEYHRRLEAEQTAGTPQEPPTT